MLLDLGLEAPFSTGTDWFIYDFSRVYARLPGDAPLSVPNWLEALRSGRSFITNGPWLEFEVEGMGPGATLELGGLPPDGSGVSVRAVGRHDFGWLELLDGGRAVASAPVRPREGGGYEARIELAAHPLDGPAWLAARIRPGAGEVNEMGQALFAHTSPVYVRENGRGVFRREVAEEIRREIRIASRLVAEGGRFDDEDERRRVLKIYREGLESLERRL